ncbi:hypothetical protein BCR36DRAFT_410129, partial [Piromyces finnis]
MKKPIIFKEKDDKNNEKAKKIPKTKTKDKNDYLNIPLKLPQPSILLQLPLTGDVHNLFWVLPYSNTNKLKITVHWPGVIVDEIDLMNRNIAIPKKPEIKKNSNISFILVQLFGIYKLAWIISSSKYILPFDRYLVQRCARSRSKLFKKAVDQAICYRKYKILPKEMFQKNHYLRISDNLSWLEENNNNSSSSTFSSTLLNQKQLYSSIRQTFNNTNLENNFNNNNSNNNSNNNNINNNIINNNNINSITNNSYYPNNNPNNNLYFTNNNIKDLSSTFIN